MKPARSSRGRRRREPRADEAGHWSDDARRDYLAIVRYIAQDSPAAAEKVVTRSSRPGIPLAAMRPVVLEKSVSRLPSIITYSMSVQRGREVASILRVNHSARDWPAQEWPK
ncbi:MAG: type II toxin-antitoxin system RelE/ParE family toxin [Hyphomicrobiales bacterium]|nr:type II toxin-antitoxin system RelE/ParE family toxin [Hyphomicrobiales bacterium]